MNCDILLAKLIGLTTHCMEADHGLYWAINHNVRPVTSKLSDLCVG